MKFRGFQYLFTAASFLILATDSAASGFRLSNQNAYVTGRGNAFVATADTPSAVYYNPAGMTQVEGNQIEGGSYIINFTVDYDGTSSDFANNDEWQTVPHFFYTNETTDNLSFGLGVYAPFGLGNDWNKSTSSFSSITKDAEVSLVTVAPALAYDLNEQISIGASINLNIADIDIAQGVGLAPNDSLRFVGDDTHVGYTLGVLWKLNTEHSLGAKYRSRANLGLSGSTYYEPLGLTSESNMDIELPDILTVGYSYKPDPTWDFGLDLEYIRWSSFSETAITKSPLGDLPQVFNWEDGYIWQLGVTRFLENGYALSAGYNYNENVQPDFLYNPVVADADRHWFNFSIAQTQGKYPWSIGYQYGTSDRNVTGDINRPITGENANGNYKTSAHSLIFTLGYKF